MSLGNWIMWHVASLLVFRWGCFHTPLTLVIKSVVIVPLRFPVLASMTLWDPWFIVWESALTYFSSVFPIVSSSGMSATRASRVLAQRCSRIWSSGRCASLLCSSYFADINGITLSAMLALLLQAHVMVGIRQLIIMLETCVANKFSIMQRR